MEFLEAFGVFSGWHCQFFKCSADDFFLPWNFDDVYFFCCNHIYHCSKAYFWRSGQWMAILVCIITFVGGIQLFCMGIMGQYLSKTYMEVKKRPHYIIQKSNDEETEKNK